MIYFHISIINIGCIWNKTQTIAPRDSLYKHEKKCQFDDKIYNAVGGLSRWGLQTWRPHESNDCK